MKISRKEKKNRDRFSISLVGAFVYSLLLISIMAGTYLLVKAAFKKEALSDVITPIEEVAEENKEDSAQDIEESVSEILEEAEEEEEPEIKDHELALKDILDEETGLVDYEKILFEPEKRNENLKWKDTVFSNIENVSSPKEAVVNSYKIKRVMATLSDQKEVSYISYINPDTDEVEKITEKVDCGEKTQIIYYYYDKGNINYIAQLDMVIDSPVSLSSADIESRYYFNSDVMVRYIYCGDDKAIEYTVQDIKGYSEGTVDQYDFLEDSMINRAYIVYNLAALLDEVEIVDGYILDEFSVPLEDISIGVYSDKDGSEVARSSTDGDGYYKFALKVSPDDTFTLKAEKEPFTGVNVYGITSLPGASRYAVDPVYLPYASNGAIYNVQILARDAIDASKGIAGGKIKLRRGINDTEGEVIASGSLDDTGAVLVPMNAGCYTVEVSKGGYETVYFPLIVRSDHQSAIGFMVPDVMQGDYTAVLSWESSPLDLDFMAISSGAETVYKSNVDGLGATMAETITINDAADNNIRFYVKDYGSIATQDSLSYNMTNSNALVTVYDSDGMQGCFHVPVASAGVVWEAFEIYNKNVIPINEYHYSLDGTQIWLQK